MPNLDGLRPRRSQPQAARNSPQRAEQPPRVLQLALANNGQGRPRTEELERLQAELKDIDQASYRQSLRLEEHDDPNHPVVALAKQRIIQLSTRRKTVEEAIRATEAHQAQNLEADEIEATLEAIPDLRDTLKSPTADELTQILDVFDVTASYDKPNRALTLSAILLPEPTDILKGPLTHTDRQMAVGAISK